MLKRRANWLDIIFGNAKTLKFEYERVGRGGMVSNGWESDGKVGWHIERIANLVESGRMVQNQEWIACK